MLGHASAALTLDRYADLFDDDLDAVADRLDAVARTARGLLADSLRTDGRIRILAERLRKRLQARKSGACSGGRYWD